MIPLREVMHLAVVCTHYYTHYVSFPVIVKLCGMSKMSHRYSTVGHYTHTDAKQYSTRDAMHFGYGTICVFLKRS